MIKWLQGHFIPHEGNEHQPHFLRSDSVQTLVALLLVSQVFFFIFTVFIAPNNNQIAAIIASTLVKQTNEERSKVKFDNLTMNDKLVKSAQLKADDMASKGYFAHNSPDGKEPWYFFRESNYEYQYAGENLAVNFVESKDVTNAWMNSKTHRENILNSKFTEVGIATSLGKYKGKDAIFVVQHFGKPSEKSLVIGTIAKAFEEQINTTDTKQSKNVLGATSVQKISVWDKILSMTGSITLSLEFAIGLLSLIALLLALLIKVKIQHPAILANGVVLVSITIGLAFINTILTQGTI